MLPCRLLSSGLQSAHPLEDLHAVVGSIADVDEAGFLVDDDAMQVAELADAGALLAPHGEELAVLVEHLHAVVLEVGDVELALARELGGFRHIELAGLAALAAEVEQELAVEIEHVDAVIAGFRHVELAVAD